MDTNTHNRFVMRKRFDKAAKNLERFYIERALFYSRVFSQECRNNQDKLEDTIETQLNNRSFHFDLGGKVFSFELGNEEAPDTYEKLCSVMYWLVKEGKNYVVFEGGCNDTIYTPTGNYCFRFVHDYKHFINELTFSFEDELRAGLLHYKEAQEKFGEDSDESLIAWADTAGQAIKFNESGKFLDNQSKFVFEMFCKLDRNPGSIDYYNPELGGGVI